MRTPLVVGPVAALALVLVACSTETAEEDTSASGESSLVSDAVSMVQRPDGLFDVVCKDGSREVVTVAQITSNDVCTSGPLVCVRRCAARYQNGSCRQWAADYCAVGATCRAHVTARYQNGQVREYGPDFCTTGPSTCVAECSARYQNGTCKTYAADRCVKGVVECVARVVARYQNGQPREYGPDFCKEGTPGPRCIENCVRRYSNGTCAEWGADICS